MVKTEEKPKAKTGTKKGIGDLDVKIRKTIGWYNKQGNLKESIRFDQVAPLMAQLHPVKAGIILSQLEGKESEINDPTGWLKQAAKKAGATQSGWGKGGGKGKISAEDFKKIGKTIGWYNKQGNLQEEIQYNQVAPIMARLGPQKAGWILSTLEGKEGEVKNPTAWLAKAARKAAEKAGVDGAGECEKKISKIIGWFNKQGKLQSEIQFRQVAPLLAQLSVGKAMHIVNGLEGKEADIKDPTAWICSAARKAGAF